MCKIVIRSCKLIINKQKFAILPVCDRWTWRHYNCLQVQRHYNLPHGDLVSSGASNRTSPTLNILGDPSFRTRLVHSSTETSSLSHGWWRTVWDPRSLTLIECHEVSGLLMKPLCLELRVRPTTYTKNKKVQGIVNRVNHRIRFLRLVKHLVDTSLSLRWYYTFVLQILECCYPVGDQLLTITFSFSSYRCIRWKGFPLTKVSCPWVTVVTLLDCVYCTSWV